MSFFMEATLSVMTNMIGTLEKPRQLGDIRRPDRSGGVPKAGAN
jgi:hypothetical protein